MNSDPNASPPAGGPASGDRWSVQALGRDFAVYDTETEDFHILNAVAHEVWKAARADPEPSSIVAHLAKIYPEADEARLTSDVDETLLELRRLRLLATD